MELGLNKVPPPEMVQQTVEEDKTGTQQTITPPAPAPVEPPKVEEPPKADEFIENFNKRYGTQYKADDEIKGLFEAPKKISEYETRLSDYENVRKSAEERQKEIERLESLNDPLKFFSSPEAYIAEQLKIKYPERDANVLQEIVTTNIDNMDDFDLLAKAERLFNKRLPEGGRYVKDVLYKRYGIDPESKPEEWDGATRTQIAMDANAWRTKIGDLRKEVDLPKVVSKEEREKLQADSLAKKMQSLTPVRDQFSKFDKLNLEGFEWQVPEDYKQKANEMFDGMFIDAGLDMNEENLATAIRLRDSNFLYENFGKIKEAIIKQAQTELQAKIDSELHNTQPPNTATATDQGGQQTLPGIGRLISTLTGK